MILHRAFRERPLAEVLPPPGAFSPAEERYLGRAARPEASRAARWLLKELAREWLRAQGTELPPDRIEVLPAPGAAGGPPVLVLPDGTLPGGRRLHVSLSHSGRDVMALLVVEDAGGC